MVVPTLDEEIYDSHLLLMISCVLELPAKNFPISSKRSRVVTLEFYGGFTRYSGHFRELFVGLAGSWGSDNYFVTFPPDCNCNQERF